MSEVTPESSPLTVHGPVNMFPLSLNAIIATRLAYPWLFANEGNVLINDALNTFYLLLYGVRHMVKDHSDSERENTLPPHVLLFLISSKECIKCTLLQRG